MPFLRSICIYFFYCFVLVVHIYIDKRIYIVQIGVCIHVLISYIRGETYATTLPAHTHFSLEADKRDRETEEVFIYEFMC